VVAVGQLSDRNVGEHCFCFCAATEPRQCVCAQKLRFWSGVGVRGRFREPVGEGQVREPDSALGGFAKQADIGWEVGVDAQCGAADDDLDVVTVVVSGQFGGHQSA
jgi:hypothetical protein